MTEDKEAIRYKVFNYDIFIRWEPEYNLGIPIIDEQHRGIVTTINSLHFGIESMHGEDMLHPVIDMVFDYTRLHFDVEEDFLKRYNYPNLKQHEDLHRELIDELQRVGRKSIFNHAPLEFLDFLKKWWIEHICEKDREFLDYLAGTLR